MFSASKTAGASTGYQIANSLRFRASASAYLNRTPASASNRTTWTYSVWLKRGRLGPLLQKILEVGASGSDYITILFNGTGSGSIDDRISLYSNVGGSMALYLEPTPIYRDPSAWYHFIFAVDTAQATASNRVKIYVNGSQITAFSATNYPAQNANLPVNNTVSHDIGPNPALSSYYYDGYMADINFIDGQALTPTSFGQFDAVTGVWTPIRYTGTYGTNGFKLNFSNGTSTTTLGYDSSGNSNNWTTNNISLTAGSTYDWMIDSPTSFAGSSYGVGNYAVLNPLPRANIGLSNGNLTLTTSGGAGSNQWCLSPATMFLSSGKWYAEFYVNNKTADAGGASIGIGVQSDLAASTFTYGNYIGLQTNGEYSYQSHGYTLFNSVQSATPVYASYTTADVIALAIDADTYTLYFYKNNTLQGSTSLLTGRSYAFAASIYQSSVISSNFGQRPFAYTPPTGFKSLCTYNLPAASITNGAQYMAATTYTGTGAAQSIANTVVNASFQPDFVWIKSRSNAYSHGLYDSVRGATLKLSSNSTNAEVTDSAGLTAFNSTGFTLGSDAGVNGSGSTFVGWQWKAGGTAVTNTAGSITSSVSANTTAGFSVVTYTGTGSAGTIGHGLGVAPSMIIVKDRTQANSWGVYHVSLGNTNIIFLDSTAAYSTTATAWNNTSPTSTVFTIGSTGTTNQSGRGFVGYCFAAIPGYSAFGSYTGNGSSDGAFIYLGFRPKFIMFKITSSTGDWQMWDASRDPYNVVGNLLDANLSNAEQTGQYSLDFLSNGVKFRSGTIGNNSGQTYIYAAFAENPFTNALAR